MNSCLQLKNITLQEHQRKIIKFILKPSVRGVLVYHSMGSGKSLTSVVAVKCLLEKYPEKKAIIITPANLVSTFEREMKKIHLDTKKIEIYSYNKFITGGHKCSGSIIIVDESHNLNGVSSERFKKIYECTKKAFKVILLSATPIRNSPSEIVNQLSLLKGSDIKRGIIEELAYLNNKPIEKQVLDKLFKCNVSFYKNESTVDYPVVKRHIINFTMTPKFYRDYYKLQEDIRGDLPEIFASTKNLTVFLNGIRRGVNKTHEVSPKISWALEKIMENKKILVYSNWLDSGINIIKTALQQAGVPFGEISGKVPKEQKDNYIKMYNSDKIKVMLISSSGGEGLSLKGTRTVVILEPHWNNAKLDQVTGRAIRYRSHSHLPENQRRVDIYSLLLEKPELKRQGDSLPSADTVLYKMAQSKEKIIDDFYKKLKARSIENDKSCI